MPVNPAADYRIKIAVGFLAEARQNFAFEQWRACVEHSQLAVENAAKMALALLGPVPRTHDPAVTLGRALQQNRFRETARSLVEQLTTCAEQLGTDIHIESSYGDENAFRTPWDLFDKTDAQRALDTAIEAVRLAEELIRQEHGR